MTSENRQPEWEQLCGAAKRYLDHPRSIPSAPELKQSLCVLRLWMRPSFDGQLAWHVFRRGRPGQETYMVRRVAWDQRTDRSRLLSRPLQGVIEGFHTAPTIEVRDRAIDAQMFREHMERLRNISIPLGAGEDTITLDGASLGVEIIRARERVVVEWRDLPPEWQPLASWREELRTWLDEVCAAPLAPRGASLSP